jgi:hypothetical protein
VAKGSIGLDVGSTAVRAAEVRLSGSQPALVRAAQVPLDNVAVENGEVRDVQAVGEAIRELWQRGGFKARQATIGVGNQRAVVREVIVPSLAPKELSQSLPYRVQEMIRRERARVEPADHPGSDHRGGRCFLPPDPGWWGAASCRPRADLTAPGRPPCGEASQAAPNPDLRRAGPLRPAGRFGDESFQACEGGRPK